MSFEATENQAASAYFKHPAALVETAQVGAGTRVGAFAHILPGAVIGAGCDISDHVFIAGAVRVGDRVTLKCGAQLWDGATLEDEVFVGSNALLLKDEFPRGKPQPGPNQPTLIRAGAAIGANATIMPGLTIGRKAVVEVGAVVTHDVPSHAIVTGHPARIVGYVDLPYPKAPLEPTTQTFAADELQVRKNTQVRGVWLHRLPVITDLRGNLSAGEIGKELPFEPKRYFVVFDVSSREVRGEHAHRSLHQFFVCLKGDCALVVDDGQQRQELLLDSPASGVHVEPLVWGIQYKFSSDALLLVLASDKYDPADYIRDYDEFERLLK